MSLSTKKFLMPGEVPMLEQSILRFLLLAKPPFPRTHHQPQRKGQVVVEVTLGKSCGLLLKSMEPLKSSTLHPKGCALNITSYEAEADANSQKPGVRTNWAQQTDQFFLFRAGQPYEHDVRLPLM